MTIDLSADAGGPPGGKAVGVNLVAQNNRYFAELQDVAREFEEEFNTQEGLVEVTNSNKQTAGQFVFSYDITALKELGLTPGQVNGQVALALNGRTAGTIASAYDDHDIKIVYDTYLDKVSPNQIEDLLISSPQ
jgi:multidrug efflux pump subunit AcrB